MTDGVDTIYYLPGCTIIFGKAGEEAVCYAARYARYDHDLPKRYPSFSRASGSGLQQTPGVADPQIPHSERG